MHRNEPIHFQTNGKRHTTQRTKQLLFPGEAIAHIPVNRASIFPVITKPADLTGGP